MPVIKRYPNRKLYDTAAKRYISLDGIADFIRRGEDVLVVDHATGDDMTNLILMQIIVEQERRQGGSVPRAVLTSLVQTGDEAMSALRRALAVPLDALRQADDEIERRVRSLVRRGELAEEEGVRLLDKLGVRRAAEGIAWPVRAEIERLLAAHNLANRTDIRALFDQLAVLETELDSLGGPANFSVQAEPDDEFRPGSLNDAPGG